MLSNLRLNLISLISSSDLAENQLGAYWRAWQGLNAVATEYAGLCKQFLGVFFAEGEGESKKWHFECDEQLHGFRNVRVSTFLGPISIPCEVRSFNPHYAVARLF